MFIFTEDYFYVFPLFPPSVGQKRKRSSSDEEDDRRYTSGRSVRPRHAHAYFPSPRHHQHERPRNHHHRVMHEENSDGDDFRRSEDEDLLEADYAGKESESEASEEDIVNWSAKSKVAMRNTGYIIWLLFG